MTKKTKKSKKTKKTKKSKLTTRDDKLVKFTTKSNKCVLINKNQLYILYLYFGIMSKLITKNIKLNTNYNLFYSKNVNKQKLLNDTKSFNIIHKLKCFFYTSNETISNYNTDILVCNLNDNKKNHIYICFSIGIRNYYNTTKSLLYYLTKIKIDEHSDTIIYKPQFYELIIVLSHIKYYLESNTYKNIVLCGHSRGMTVATYCAYILLILSSDDDMISTLPKHHHVKEFCDALLWASLPMPYRQPRARCDAIKARAYRHFLLHNKSL